MATQLPLTHLVATICGGPGIPGLIAGCGKCQQHWNEGVWGKVGSTQPIAPQLTPPTSKKAD